MAFRTSAVAYIATLVLMWVILNITGLDFQKTLSLIVFTGIIAGSLLYWRFRLAFVLAGIGILLMGGLIDLNTFISSANFDVIVFLLSMMIIVGYLEERRFFEVLLEKVLKVSGARVRLTITLLMCMAALLAALVDEVTSIFFIASTAIRLSSRVGVSPIPLVIMSVFATNIGSSATAIGNPVGVMIALRSGYGFMDFLKWATPIALVALTVTILITQFYFRRYIREMRERLREIPIVVRASESESNERSTYLIPAILFASTLTALILHREIERALNIPDNNMLVGVAVIAAAVALLLEKGRAREIFEKRVDWWTLIFFALFFSSVGTLVYSGVSKLIAERMVTMLSGATPLATLMTAGWIIGPLAAFMDNVLAVAVWVPIISELSNAGLELAPLLWWVTLFGATYMGNLTIIGSTSNIVAASLVERQGLGHVSQREWIKVGAPVSLSTFMIALMLLYLRTAFS